MTHPSAETIRETALACERIADRLYAMSDDLLHESAAIRGEARELLALLRDDAEFQALREREETIIPLRRKSA